MNDYFYLLEKCELCPRKCRVNRLAGETGYCKSGAGYEVSSVCIHKGEEPPISGEKGICNIFFSHCNIQCVFCQNHQISDNNSSVKTETPEHIIRKITGILDKGINAIGFVSPTHFLPQVIAIINAVRNEGYNPVTVWNSNAYELPENISLLDNWIDVFMPDFKYSDKNISKKYSDAPDYPEIAETAIKKMVEMRGTRLICDDSGLAVMGILIRHLVLPSLSGQSTDVLKTIAQKLSVKIPVSLMSQYHPGYCAHVFPEINRLVSRAEYRKVSDEMRELGLAGWVQEHDSPGNYKPDFCSENPFEKQ